MTKSPEIYQEPPESNAGSRSPNRNFTRQVLTVIGLVALSALILGLLWYGAEIILLVFAGLLLAIFLRFFGDLVSHHTPLSETWSLIIILLTFMGLLAFGAWLSSDSMQTQFDELSEQLPVAVEQLGARISQYPLGRRIVEQIPSGRQILVGRQQSNVFGRITGMFSTAFDVAINVLVVFITALYFAFNPQLYSEGIVKLVPQGKEKRAREILSTREFTLRRFLLGVAGTMTFNGIFTRVRGLAVHHSTIFRWMQRCAPEINERRRAAPQDDRHPTYPQARFIRKKK